MIDKLENSLLICNSMLAVTNLETTLSLIILCVQLFILCYKLVLSFVSKIKNNKVDETVDSLEEFVEDLTEYKNNLKGEEEKKNE